MPSAAKYKEVFLENFNAAVTENALKWHAMEPTPGQGELQRVDAILAWTDEHDIPLRGHNIFWGFQRVQEWLKELDDDTCARRSSAGPGHRPTLPRPLRRVRSQQRDDPRQLLRDRSGPEITPHMAHWVGKADPDAASSSTTTTSSPGKRSTDYVAHIRGLLDQGVPIGGIGVQGHLHGDTFDPVALRTRLTSWRSSTCRFA